MTECSSRALSDPFSADDERPILRELRRTTSEACALIYRRSAPGIHRFITTRLGGGTLAPEEVLERVSADLLSVGSISREGPA